jgi:predicted Zn-dependent protease with MMP-like domain
MSNVEIVVEDEPPDGQPLLGLYRGVPLPRRSSRYDGVLPDKISIFRGPITRLAADGADRLRREVSHVVLHEIAHHFGISGVSCQSFLHLDSRVSMIRSTTRRLPADAAGSYRCR